MRTAVLLLATVLAVAGVAKAQELCTVGRIVDGDTLVCAEAPACASY